MNHASPPVRLGFVPANRGFFSQELAAKMRLETIAAMKARGVEVVVPDESMTKLGCVQSIPEAAATAALFRRQDVQGIVIGAVNFGDEQAAAWAVKQARLDVPVMIFGCQEEETLRPTTARRDAFCGLLSIGDALRQIGAKYSVASRPIGFPRDEAFGRDVDWFARVCRVVNAVRSARYGQVGARPEAFWTCRYDEKQLQRLGPTTVVLDLSEALAGAERLKHGDPEVAAIVKAIQSYADTSAVAPAAVEKMARFELFLRRWAAEHGLSAMAIQCWTSIQQNFGVCACTSMSRLADAGIPAACEADILGALSMHASMLASGSAAALADWNNLHNDDDGLVNIWHCGVFPRSFAKSQPRLSVHGILVSSGAAPAAQAQGIVELQVKPSPLTLTRVTQDGGVWKALVEQGRIEENPATTSGSYGWCRIRGLQHLYRNVLLRHFPHHVAITQAEVGNVLWEAFGNYLGMQMYNGAQAPAGVSGQYTPALPFA